MGRSAGAPKPGLQGLRGESQTSHTRDTEDPAVLSAPRRYDVDWLRVIAIGLLIVFHVALGLQSWAADIGFPQNEQLLSNLVPFVSMLAVWRIPLLFVIPAWACASPWNAGTGSYC